MDADLSELAGFSFRCIPGCGFCCNLVVGVPAWERPRIVADARFPPLKAGTDGSVALPLVNGSGSCAVLSEERTCRAYDGRPEPCRLFPFHLHLLHRRQVNLDLTCRGLWEDAPEGRPAEQAWRHAIASVPEETIRREERLAAAVFEEFRAEAAAAGVFAAPDDARRAVSEALPDPFDRANLDVAAEAAGAKDAVDWARERLREAAGSDDPLNLPIYLERDLSWLEFRVEGTAVGIRAWDRAGRRTPRGSLELRRAGLLPLDPEARDLLGRYAGLLLARDHLYGSAAAGVAASAYAMPVAEALLDVWGGACVDAWFRGSLLAALRGERRLDRAAALDGIVATDIDVLDAPTIGATI